ncbi:MAG TPA: biotin transporter BioY [Methanocella sp.]|uniref:biotin transporter BioY n=1 Tax=Methanocella sp. TaxID=2052833 RepID=UPI002C833CAC|nr:biotin transporter BioY [Methanocella sp.]HTY91274.1 biotin transporter BioY [Methanocella sp.]
MPSGLAKDSQRVKKLVYAALFAALTAVSAWVAIPLPYVPITLQTFFVILSGGTLGAYFGGLSMAVYLLLGFMGLPVFARGQSGLGTLAGPTGGYLVGFVLCAVVTGLIVKTRKKPGLLWYMMAMAAGTLVIYACGLAQLCLILHMPAKTAFVAGMLAFIPGDLIKIAVAAFVATKLNFDSEATF